MGKTLVVGSLSKGSGGVNAEYPICGLNRRRMGCYHWIFLLVFGASAPAITVYLVRYRLVPFVF